MRHPEQGSTAMGGAPGLGQCGPGGVTQRLVQRFGVARRFPGRDFGCEARFGQRRAEPDLQRRAQSRAVETMGVGVFFDGLTLHEQALAGMHRV